MIVFYVSDRKEGNISMKLKLLLQVYLLASLLLQIYNKSLQLNKFEFFLRMQKRQMCSAGVSSGFFHLGMKRFQVQ